MGLSESASGQSRPFRHRRRLAAAALSLALLTTVGYWLGATGSTGTSISPPPGSPSSGEVADVTPLSSSVTQSNGAAQLQVGVALARIAMAKSTSNHFRLQVAWTDANQADQVLNNPNAQISIGLYHAIHTGNCNAASHSVDAPLVNITDSDNNTYCGSLDQSATGSSSVSSTGKLLLARNLINGDLVPALDGSGSISSCASSANDSGSWCQPASITDPDQRALFLVASIVTPGGIPQGQQPQLTSLTFFEQATRVQ